MNSLYVSDFCNLIKKIRSDSPTMRIGQIIENSLGVNDELYYMDDDILIAKLKQYSKEINKEF